MSKAFRKVYLHHEVLYKMNNVAEFTSAWFFMTYFGNSLRIYDVERGSNFFNSARF